MDILRFVQREPLVPSCHPSVDSMRAHWTTILPKFESLVDRAVASGFVADRLAWAFWGGYQMAVRALVGDCDVGDEVCAFAATEMTGAHPRAIATTLERVDETHVRLVGQKTFVTLGKQASTLFVVAKEPNDDAERPRLRLVRVGASCAGVTSRELPEIGMIPEVHHSIIEFDARVPSVDVFDGDGYERFLKPFRTIEDIYVMASVVGYLIGVGRRHQWPIERLETLLAQVALLRELSDRSPSERATHVALAGALRWIHETVSASAELWQQVNDNERMRWERDRSLLSVAAKVREQRRQAAWRPE